MTYIRHSAKRCPACRRPLNRGHAEGCWVANVTISRFA